LTSFVEALCEAMAFGQFFSQRFGYGVHALAYMAKKPTGALSSLPELAAWMQTIWPAASETYLSNVIQRLARGGLLRSHRGVSGGYSLAKPAPKITLRDVVELLEGIDVARCSLSLAGDCSINGRCSIQLRMNKLERDYLESLAQISIADLANDVVVELDKQRGSDVKV
jgi:Rrf2 family protein